MIPVALLLVLPAAAVHLVEVEGVPAEALAELRSALTREASAIYGAPVELVEGAAPSLDPAHILLRVSVLGAFTQMDVVLTIPGRTGSERGEAVRLTYSAASWGRPLREALRRLLPAHSAATSDPVLAPIVGPPSVEAHGPGLASITLATAGGAIGVAAVILSSLAVSAAADLTEPGLSADRHQALRSQLHTLNTAAVITLVASGVTLSAALIAYLVLPAG